MPDDGIPPWVDFLSKQIGDFRREVNDRLDRLVSRDAFVQEQKRVNEKFDDVARQLGDVARDLQAESTARVAAELAAANAARQEAEKRQQVARQTSWQWFAVIATPVVAAAVTWVIAGGLAP